MSTAEKVPIYAYYYPLTTVCDEKQQRAQEHETTVVNETALAASAVSLFDGHDQPKTYCLGDASVSVWDDADPEVMEAQTDLASSHGIDGFIFDTYIGEKRGRRMQEVSRPLDHAFLGSQAVKGMQFAISAVLDSPRAVLPVSRDRQQWERGRAYDYSKGTAEAITDACATKYWEHGNYIRMPGDRPYMSLWFSRFSAPPTAPEDARLNALDIAEHIKSYSERRYKVSPYIAAVCLNVGGARSMRGSSFDALTGYAFLPDFNSNADSIQDYAACVDKRAQEWPVVAAESGLPFVPPVVLGWDSSPRGALRPYGLEDIEGIHPFGPIVTGVNRASFEDMLMRQCAFVADNVPKRERYVPICSWNEVTEGNALLPRVTHEGMVDNKYLAALSRFVMSMAV